MNKKFHSTFTNKEKLAREMINSWTEKELKRYAKWKLQAEFDSLTDEDFDNKFKRFYELEEYSLRDHKMFRKDS
jgi:hypothetical protein